MGVLSATTTAANIVWNTYQSQQQAAAQRARAELDANTLEAQAARKDLEAGEALKIGQLNMAEQQAEGRLDIGRQRAEYGASGVKVNEGTPAETLADKAAWNEYERQKLEYESNLQSWGLKYDAELLRQQAANTRASGASSGVSALGNAIGSTSALVEQLKNK